MLKIILSIVVAIAGWGIQRAIVWLNRKLQESKFMQKLEKAKNIIKSVVENLYQSIVQREKQLGAFDDVKQQQVLQLAVEQSKSYMDKSIKKFITREYIDINSWIQTEIEATIYTLKRADIKLK